MCQFPNYLFEKRIRNAGSCWSIIEAIKKSCQNVVAVVDVVEVHCGCN